MPFDFQKYDEKCATLDGAALQREWEHYTRLISGAATSTAVSGIAVPFTLGVSSIGVALAAPSIHNARKKREIIERHMQRQGGTVHTRKRDVITAGAISGTLGVVTLGLAPIGADVVANSAAEHGIAYIVENELGTKIVTHLALDGAGVAIEEKHAAKKKEKAAWKAYAQAVKEGKNPPLPASDVKLPVNPVTQTIDLNTTPALPQTPLISIVPPTGIATTTEATAMYFPPPPGREPSISTVPPTGQVTTVEATAMYFPPPPGQESLMVQPFQNRRHSISTLSMPSLAPTSEQVQPKPEAHLIYGTTTAISAPMVAGHSYCIQVSDKVPDESSRPPSATPDSDMYITSTGAPPIQQTQIDNMSQIITPPPPYVRYESTIQLQPPQRPRAHSSCSSLSSYQIQQSQLVHGATNFPISPLTPPPSVPISPPSQLYSTPMTDYFTMNTSDQSQYRPDLQKPSIWTPPCTSDELPSQSQPDCKQTTGEAYLSAMKMSSTDQLPTYEFQPPLKMDTTSWMTPDPHSTSQYDINMTKTPVYWTTPDPMSVGSRNSLTSSTALWTTPDPHATSSTEKRQQALYFPPPPPNTY